jgi:hypothetical protein
MVARTLLNVMLHICLFSLLCSTADSLLCNPSFVVDREYILKLYTVKKGHPKVQARNYSACRDARMTTLAFHGVMDGQIVKIIHCHKKYNGNWKGVW